MSNPAPFSYPSRLVAWSTVFVLLLAAILSFVDRQILNLLVDPIRRDLHISDTQMSLLMGFSFAVFYVLCGIPFGRLADTANRKKVIAGGVALWSLATAACGLSTSYWKFLLGRIGVGVGEASLTPAAYSIIADSFEPHRRATAFSVYAMGIYLGSGVAFLVTSVALRVLGEDGSVVLPVLGVLRTWQVIFVGLGAVGLAFSVLFLMLREPPRQKKAGLGVDVSFAQFIGYVKRHKATVLYHNFGFAFLAFAAYGNASWVPSFFVRTYGWSVSQTASVYGGIVAVVGCLGIITGGRLADRMSARGRHDANMRVGFYAALGAVPGVLAFPLAPSGLTAAICLAPTIFFLSMPFGVAAAAVQEFMPNEMRGRASAVYMLVLTLIGLGVGPTAVALFTDFVFRDDAALRYSLLIVGGTSVAVAAVLLQAGLKPYARTVEALRLPAMG